ncbi:MAG: hypothetical protein A3G41_07345 [Elusimicrobia bacterium RIFCSPLOWO2_12_FULL_59_9]|nr:MAG: hypothetical protein A3G41_07345 [Elusimicrobia bacterium RIFCSPLOWO2_12_FULL_59_9]
MNFDPQKWSALFAPAGYSEVYWEDSRSLSIRIEESRLAGIKVVDDRGMGLRYLFPPAGGANCKTLFTSLNGWDFESAKNASARILESGRRLAGGQKASAPGRGTREGRDWKIDFRRLPVMEQSDDVSWERKAGRLQDLDRLVRDRFPYIRQVSIRYQENVLKTGLINSDGDYCGQEGTATTFLVEVVAEKEGVRQSGYESSGAWKGWEYLSEIEPEKLALRAARRAVSKLSAKPAPAGEMPVILSGSAGGTFIHEAIGHSLEADHIQEGTSPAYAGKIGQKVAPQQVTIIDDPTLPFGRGSYAFDGEGVAARPTTLVENGVLKDYLFDRRTAYAAGRASNGHGRREAYHCVPIPRMSNLYMAPGRADPRRMIAALDKGFLVTHMGAGQVNTATGEFVFEVDEGFLIERGKVAGMLRDASLLGLSGEVLNNIGALGRDIGWAVGVCGKSAQHVPVADGIPTMRLSKMVVGGK